MTDLPGKPLASLWMAANLAGLCSGKGILAVTDLGRDGGRRRLYRPSHILSLPDVFQDQRASDSLLLWKMGVIMLRTVGALK